MDKDLAEAARKGFCETLIEELRKDVQWLKSKGEVYARPLSTRRA